MNIVYVMKEEWDYLIVLDAARYDLFKEYNRIKGKLEKRHSPGSCTEEWVLHNFTKKYNDVLYITANPMTSIPKLNKITGMNPFYKVDEVWDYGWDDNMKGVYPEEVTKASISDIMEYPNKRLLIHYLQPHFPFVENPETWIGRGLSKEYLESKGIEFDKRKLAGIVHHYIGTILTPNQVREGYTRNLIRVLKNVEELIEYFPKSSKIIITSDHGEMLGYPEDGGGQAWGHGLNIGVESLRLIPWFVVKNE